MKCIVDTNILMEGIDLSSYDEIFVPIIVLEEIDKHSHSDSPEKSYKARVATRFISDSQNVKVVIREFREKDYQPWMKQGIVDNTILLYVKYIQEQIGAHKFLTMDLNLVNKAKAMNLLCELYRPQKKIVYKGYHEVMMDEVELAEFLSDISNTSPINKFNLLENQYLIIYNLDGTLAEKFRWTSEGYKYLNTREFKSQYFGSIKPISDDPTQYCAFDSLYRTEITVLFGRAGTGKSILSLAFLMSQLQSNKINKLYIVHSFETLKGAKTLGFLPGNKEDKIFGSNIGGILSTKFGGIEQTIKPLIQSNRLEIIPTAELRGVEFNFNDAMFITEAQNTDPYTMKTMLQRCKEGCKIVIEGDMLEQTDIRSAVNGMERVIEVFSGEKCFSCVKLEKNHRNPICELADKI